MALRYLGTQACLALLAVCAVAEVQEGGQEAKSSTTTRMGEWQVRLPGSKQAVSLDVAEEYPHTLSILADGRTSAAGKLIFDPEGGDQGEALDPLLRHLENTARVMQKGPLGAQGTMLVPKEPLLLRVDATTQFRHVKTVMESCGRKGIQITQIELAVTSQRADGSGNVLHAHLPTDVHEAVEEDVEPVERVEVTIRVEREGRRILADGTGEPWTGERDVVFRYDESRQLSYQLGPVKTSSLAEVERRLAKLQGTLAGPLLIDARPGTTHGEVVGVMDAALAVGFSSITFVGRYR